MSTTACHYKWSWVNWIQSTSSNIRYVYDQLQYFLSIHVITQQQDYRRYADCKEDSQHIVCHCPVKGKGKVHPTTGHQDREVEKRYSSTLSLTSAVDGIVVNVTPRPLYPRKREAVPIVEEAVWAPDRSGRGRKISPPSKFDPRTVEPVVSPYTNWATPAPHCPVLACKRYRTWGSMFLRPKDLEKLRVGSILSLVANTGLGLVS